MFSYLWLLQLDNWSILLSCLYFVFVIFFLIYYVVKICKGEENKEIFKKIEKCYFVEDEYENEIELLWIVNEEDELYREFLCCEERLLCYYVVFWVL